jgi:hypothetical protein
MARITKGLKKLARIPKYKLSMALNNIKEATSM